MDLFISVHSFTFDLTWIIDSIRFDCPSTNQSTDRVACCTMMETGVFFVFTYTYKETGDGKNPEVEKEMIDIRQFVFVADLDERQTQFKLN